MTLVHTRGLMTEICMIWKLFSLILWWWGALISLTLRLIVIIYNFWCKVSLLFLILHLLQCYSDKLFQLFDFIINLHISKVFFICCSFYFLNFLFYCCQLLLFYLLYFLFFFFFLIFFIWVAYSGLLLPWLMPVVFMLDFLHFLH